MYPIYTWTYEQLCSRLDSLISHEFYHESVIASAQTIEQIIRRILKQYMTRYKKGFLPENGKFILVPINSKEQRDEILKSRIRGLSDMKKGWNKLVADKVELRLPNIINSIIGENSWAILNARTEISIPYNEQRVQVTCGLFTLRHRIIHGTHSSSSNDTRMQAIWGVQAVKKLLHPESGISSRIGWDPQQRISPFRSRG